LTAEHPDLPGFDNANLAAEVEALTAEDVDKLPFGAIRLDAGGIVRLYNATERRQSGFKARPAISLDFFAEIAPCMDNPEFKGRIETARKAGTVDIEMGWIGDFADRNRELTVRIQSASDGGLWLFHRRDDADPRPGPGP
jgi:photoactive yellow protein